VQLRLEGFSTTEQEQFQRNLSALKARVAQIPAEIGQEQAAIERRFAGPQPRLLPVAITFFVPRKLIR
jgi:asparagine synthetase A